MTFRNFLLLAGSVVAAAMAVSIGRSPPARVPVPPPVAQTAETAETDRPATFAERWPQNPLPLLVRTPTVVYPRWGQGYVANPVPVEPQKPVVVEAGAIPVKLPAVPPETPTTTPAKQDTCSIHGLRKVTTGRRWRCRPK